MAKNQYSIDKLPTKYQGICPVYVVRNRDTGLIKFAAFHLYNAQDLAKFANGRKPDLARMTGFLTQSDPARFEIPCNQIEG